MADESPVLVEHFFRHEYGRLVSSLARKYGVAKLERIEDAVQSALEVALTSWALRGIPDKPGAWLYRVAQNQIVDQFRRDGVASRQEKNEVRALEDCETPAHFQGEIADDELRMLFVCCDDQLPARTQLVLALKILCGFSVREIAFRLLKSEESVNKRIGRGRSQLREMPAGLQSPSEEQLRSRIRTVQAVIYLLFNEGYSSSLADKPIRREMCEEAIRLCQLLVAHPVGDHPESWALLALMHLHHARIEARSDGAGALLLLEEQDRSKWNQEHIHAGLSAISRSAKGNVFSRFHAEAGILVEHCLAPSYSDTRWEKIVELYELLEAVEPSPMYTLNRAIAVGEWKGAEAGLAIILAVNPPSWLMGYYLWDATLGELYRRAGDLAQAKKHLGRALEAAPTDSEKQRLRARLRACD